MIETVYAAGVLHVAESVVSNTPPLLDFQHPVFIGSVCSLLTVLVTRVVDLLIARRKARDDFRHSDRELLSKDEKEFRLTIIKQLQECRDSEIKKDKEIRELNATILNMNRKIIGLEFDADRMRNQISAIMAAAGKVQAAADQVKDAATLPSEDESK